TFMAMRARSLYLPTIINPSLRLLRNILINRDCSAIGGLPPRVSNRSPMRDGAILRANVYRPNADECFPVLMTFGPYGKDVPLREFMQEAWDRLNATYPEILAASSCKHLVFERPDPEMWVPDGYVVVNVDSRGAGKSPGRLDPNSPAEFRDF